MRTLAILFLSTALRGLPAMAESPDSCMTAGQQPPNQGLAPLATVEARLLFIYFPQAPTGQAGVLPAWSNWLVDEMKGFVQSMSHGQQTLNLKIVKRAGADSTKAWRAPNPASIYQTAGTYGTLNNQVMQKVHSAYPNYWNPVNMVFVITYESPFFEGRGGGVGGLGGVSVPGFTECYQGTPGCIKRGETQRLFTFDSFTASTNQRVAGGAAHEYGHVLFDRLHSPYSGNFDPPNGPGTPPGQCHLPAVTEYVNMGRYDLMRGTAASDGRPSEGVLPYHPMWLQQPDVTQPNFSWVPIQDITTDTRDLRMKQIRDTAGKIYRVTPTNTTLGQNFVFANYQCAASSTWDAKLIGTGLLVWHILPFRAWDLESAWGKAGIGVSGRDTLEDDWCFEGFAGDFFTNSPPQGLPTRMNFGPGTNPNTNLWSQNLYTSPQSWRTSVAIENIRQDVSSTDMLVDVYLSPKQYVLYPNGGEFIPKGQGLTMAWFKRDFARITKVDVALLQGGSPIFQAWNQANTGAYNLGGIGGLATNYAVRVTSYDSLANALDESDASFTVWGIQDASIQENITQWCAGTTPMIKFDITWTTSVATGGADSILVYAPGSCTGSTTHKATVTPGSATTTHNVMWQGTCSTSGNWWYTISTTKAGGGTHRIVCRIKAVTCSSCGACPPPCDLD